MGRFKRHQRRKYKTSVVHTPHGDISVSVSNNEPINAPLTTDLLRKLFMSLKKRHKFGDFIQSYAPIGDLLYKTDGENAISAALANRNLRGINIGKIFLQNPLYIHNYDELFDSIVGRLHLLHNLMHKYQRRDKMQVSDVIEPYLIDELEKRGKKVYPNEMAFGFLFGSIFAIVGLIIISYFIWRLFSPLASMIVCGVIMVLLLVFKLSINTNHEVLEEYH